MKLRRLTATLSVACVLPLAVVAAARAEDPKSAPGVGLLLKVVGKVTYRAEGGQKAAADARPYMKVRQGDHMTVPDKSALEIVYFASSRKEAWKGPVTFKVGVTESAAEGAKPPKPEVTTVPAGAVEGVKRIPPLLRKAGVGRSGATHVRASGSKTGKKPDSELSKEEQAEIAAAREVYNDLKKSSAEGDATADLYLLGVLADYEQYGEMETLVSDALKKAPKSEELKAIETWVKEQHKK